MKTKIIVAVLFILIAVKSHSFGGGHDSLLFDGAQEIRIIQSNFDDECNIKVTKVSGVVVGTRKIKEIYSTCGVFDTTIRTESAAQLKVDNIIVKREEIRTGEDGYIKLELPDGSVIVLGPNSSIYIDEEMCEYANSYRTSIRIMAGKLWTKVKKLIGGGKFEVSTERGGGIGVRGTELSVETSPERDIVKVYEGSVEVSKNMDAKSVEQVGYDAEKLTKDYEEGKITMEEMSRRMMEMGEKSKEISDKMKPVIVEAGFMVTVTDKPGTPEALPTGETKWFEDPRIK